MTSKTISIIAAISICFFSGNAFAIKAPSKSIEILMDDSATILNPEAAEKAKFFFLQQIKGLKSKRGFRDARLEVISMSSGKTLWIGSPAMMDGEEAERLINVIKSKENRCNNMVRGFDALKSSLRNLDRRARVNEIWVLIFSPMINTPEPCKTSKIDLPQVVPTYDFVKSLTASEKVRVVSLYWVHERQFDVWEDALKGLTDWQKQAQNRKWSMHKEPATLYELAIGLDGARK